VIHARAHDLLVAPLGLQLLDLISQRHSGEVADEDLWALLPELDAYVTRYRGDYDLYVGALRSKAAALASLAEWLPRRMPTWWHDLDRANQAWVTTTVGAPHASRFTVDLTPMHQQAPKPKRAFWTSTRTGPSISPWLVWPERPLSVPSYVWKIVVSDTARVAEIHSPEQWSAFARTYPGGSPGVIFTGMEDPPTSALRLDPDWSKVAQEWDGVHLSIGGWLTAEDVPNSSGGATTELRGWNVESTVWLRWSFESVAPVDGG